MYYDLNIPWTQNTAELEHTLKFLAELDYNVIALNHTISGKLPSEIISPIPKELPFAPSKLHILHRCTLQHDDPSQNHRLQVLAQHYDILALRPTNEKSLQQACHSLDCDLISLDCSKRFPFHFRHKALAPALARGVRFEICYADGINDNLDGAVARRNLISNATGLIRALRGRGIILSSGAHTALACRGPLDIVNLATVWGLGQERGMEAVSREARAVVVQAQSKRQSYRGVVELVEAPEAKESPKEANVEKRKADDNDSRETQISKREQRRRAKRAKVEAAS